MLVILLLGSLALLFYILTGGKLPEKTTIKNVVFQFGFPAASAALFLLAFSTLFGSKLVGAVWAVLGWFVPIWSMHGIRQRKLNRNRELAKSLITSMGGLYGAGQTTTEAVATCMERMPEPFMSDLQDILGRRKLDPNASFKKMFSDMGSKYDLPELNGMAAIISAAESAGGPTAASKGLKRLGRALRLRDKLKAERKKTMFETNLAAYVVTGLLSLALFADGVWGSHLFASVAGTIALTISSMMIVGMIIMTIRLSSSADID